MLPNMRTWFIAGASALALFACESSPAMAQATPMGAAVEADGNCPATTVIFQGVGRPIYATGKGAVCISGTISVSLTNYALETGGNLAAIETALGPSTITPCASATTANCTAVQLFQLLVQAAQATIQCQGLSAEQTAVTTANPQNTMCDLYGKLVTSPYAGRDSGNRSSGSSASTGTPITILTASGSASLKEYLTDLECFRTDTGTSAVYVTLNDSASTTFPIPPVTSGASKSWNFPLVGTANTAMTATLSANVTTAFCSGSGFNGH